jgi:hypothetical protein
MLGTTPACFKRSGINPLPTIVKDKRIRATGNTQQVSATAGANGAVTGLVTANSVNAQLLQASDSSLIAGSSVLFPPGSLAIETTVTLAPGSPLTNSAFEKSVGVSSTATAASQPVVVTSSVQQDGNLPFIINLQLPTISSLNLADDPYANLVVYYGVKKVGAGGTFAGIFSRSNIEIVNNKVQIQSKYFGTFQAVLTAKLIDQATEVAVNRSQITGPRFYVSGVKSSTFDSGLQKNNGYQGWFLKTTLPKVTTGSSTLTSGYVLRYETD